MLNMPHTWTPETIRKWTEEVGERKPSGAVVPTRPIPYHGLCLVRRVRAAWRVITGKADLLEWPTHD
jgi:hypothetical protein